MKVSSTILIADADSDLRDVLAFLLQSRGHDVLLAGDGAAALRLWRERAPDLILTELDLPGLSGWDLCERVLGDAPARVAILSRSDGAAERTRAQRLGVAEYIGKPFASAELLQRIGTLLDQPAPRA
jgi:DNA-binding response OmpR family regulator